MTKKDYELIAGVFKTSAQFQKEFMAENDQDDETLEQEASIKLCRERLAEELADKFAAQNSRFDRTKFLTACGNED